MPRKKTKVVAPEAAPAEEGVESASPPSEEPPAPVTAEVDEVAGPTADAVPNGVGEAKESGSEEVKKKKKPMKKTVPDWATLSEAARKSLPKAQVAKPKVQDSIIAAISTCGDSKGLVSAGTIRSFVMKENPGLPKMVLKKGVIKAVERGLIKQVKGKGFSGSFKLETPKNVAKAQAKVAKSASKVKEPLESVFPGVFTWATNPKESSVGLIKKYISKNYPDLDVESNAFRKAIDQGEAKGQLKRLTGKGFSGTFQLVDGANKTGGKFEDAIENAIISMNEPKQVSVSGLRDYLSCWHNEYNTDNRPTVLKNALARCVERGWLQQVSGRGFSGSYRLMYPYHPSPADLWGEHYEHDKKEKPADTPSKGKKRVVVEDSEEEPSSEEEEEAEYVPVAKKRGAPKPRANVTAKKKAVPQKKGKARKPKKK